MSFSPPIPKCTVHIALLFNTPPISPPKILDSRAPGNKSVHFYSHSMPHYIYFSLSLHAIQDVGKDFENSNRPEIIVWLEGQIACLEG